MSYQQHSLVPVDGGWIVAHRFAAEIEQPRPLSVAGAPVRCLLVTPIGFAAESIDPLARTLAGEGIEVITFDLRNHAGESTGEANSFLLSSAVRDCRAMVDAVRPDLVAAVGIASRVVARVLPDAPGVRAAAFLTPVVDIAGTLERKRRQAPTPRPDTQETACFFEANLDRPEIWADADEHGLTTFDSTLDDLERFHGILHLIAGSDDPCVRFGQVSAIAERLPRRPRVRTVESNRHLIDDNVESGSRMLGALIDELTDLAADQIGSDRRLTSDRPTWGTRSASLTASSRA